MAPNIDSILQSLTLEEKVHPHFPLNNQTIIDGSDIPSGGKEFLGDCTGTFERGTCYQGKPTIPITCC
jgi:hypothetical protein